MILIGENINIMSKRIGAAMREHDIFTLQEMARLEEAEGVDYLEVNIGPARKAGTELMEWIVGGLQEVTHLPLSLDTTNLEAMEKGLETASNKVLVNSISLQPERLEHGLEMVARYNADMIGLLWGTEGMPRDANERAMLAVDLIYQANEAGIPDEHIWIDPIMTPVSVDTNQLQACFEFMSMLGEIAPGCKSVIGLSNVSNGTPAHLRPYLNRTCLMILMKYGIQSAIVDAFDYELAQIARGENPELVQFIHRLMDGDEPDVNQLDDYMCSYYKTFQVLTGQKLYSHSWLEM